MYQVMLIKCVQDETFTEVEKNEDDRVDGHCVCINDSTETHRRYCPYSVNKRQKWSRRL